MQADNRRTIFLLLDGANDQSKFDEFGLAVHTIYQEKLSGEAKPLRGQKFKLSVKIPPTHELFKVPTPDIL